MMIYVLNGPNLNLLGTRQPEIYGTDTLESIETRCRALGESLSCQIAFRQTNDEGQLIAWVHEAGKDASGIVINPAAFTHSSLALREAIASVGLPVAEVHISNIYARESWRASSHVSSVARVVIAGAGPYGYELALSSLMKIIDKEDR